MPEPQSASPWPEPPAESVLFLLDAAHSVEQTLLEQWYSSTRDGSDAAKPESKQVALSVLFGKKGRLEVGGLPEFLDGPDDMRVVPLRVVWLPPKSRRRPGPRLRDLLAGDPRHPRRWVASTILKLDPDRAQPVAGASATLGELRAAYETLQEGREASPEDDNFAAFVVRRAGVALDIAERRVRGNRYKVPHYVAHGVRSSPKFRRALKDLSKELGEPVHALRARADKYMKEMIAQPNSFFIDWMGKITRSIVSLGYSKEIVVDPADIERLRKIMRDHPTALLWTHKSHIDAVAVISVLYENDLPAPHSFGGINMAVPGLGIMGRRSGIIYIRRSFQDNPVYKLVFRHYLGYLMEKRFPLTWSFEGTRSRVGKLMPPKYGLMKYVVEAAHATHTTDLHFVPVSISYDLIGEASEYAREQAGKKKRPESFSWLVGYLRKMRAPKGSVYLDIGAPVAIKGTTPPPDSIDLHKIAFEVAVRVNNMTPVTFPAIGCMALLAAAPRALTLDELTEAVLELFGWLRERKIRMTSSLHYGDDDEIQALAKIVLDRKLISRYDEGPEPVYSIDEDRYPVASYYRNTIVHYFVNKAISELAWASVLDRRPADRLDAFWTATDRLRDLLKFEFFYSPKDEFRQQIDEELSRYNADWQESLSGTRKQVTDLLAGMRPLIAHASLLPYIEAYGVVAGVLAQLEPGAGIDEKDCVNASLKLGHQRYLQRRVSSKASIAKLLFSNGYRLFSNLGLTGEGDASINGKRVAIAEEFEQLSAQLDVIESLAKAGDVGRKKA
ncbi:MAG: glycerol-3-phosphate 1-O-acyltransferase [Woeseiaceae bacterium]|nr:glycerol-3-phosphate 1-O-acyltransferase [Woeseiaceae bacterium]